MIDSSRPERLSSIGVIMAIVLGLYLSSLYSYLLFHSLIEITTIAIGCTLFILTWNARRFLTNDCLKILGIGYAFISLIDLLHAISYKGINVFPGYGANLPTQLWIAARYLQAVTLLTAPFFVESRLDNRAIFGVYAVTVSTLVAMVYVGIFPDCFIEGKGLTAFKIGSEYAITTLLLASLYLFYRKRKYFNYRVFFLTASSIVFTAFSEISFTAYVSVYGFANMVGHFTKLAAFYLIYRAILVTGLKEPFELIFRDLKLAEEALRKTQDTLEIRVRERTAELQASEEKYRTLIECANDAVFIHEIKQDGMPGPFIEVNELAYTRLGYSKEELLRLSPMELDDPRYRNRIAKAMERLLEDGHAVFETAQIAKDGSSIPVEVSTRVLEQNETRLLFSLVRDITERKNAEEEIKELNEGLEQRVAERTLALKKKSEELNDSQNALMNIVEDLNEKTVELEQANSKLKELDSLKSMFIASMSHELRTPLNSIIGFSSIMLNEWTGPLTAEQNDNIAAVLRSGKHLLSLINDVIDVSKIEAGRIESIVEEFDVRDVVMEAVEALKKDIEKKGLKLIVSAPRQFLHADRRRLLQCLLNLVSNAVKYTIQGSISVSAELSTDGSLMTIAVEDTGIGIKEDELGILFSPFVRLHTNLGSIVPGTGLGLYLTRKLVREVLCGDILVSSVQGKGSTFTLIVPPATGGRT